MSGGGLPEDQAREQARRVELLASDQQKQLRLAAEVEAKRVADLQTRLLDEHGPRLEKLAELHLLEKDKDAQKSAAELIAHQLAKNGTQNPDLVRPADLLRIVDHAVGQALQAQERKGKEEAERGRVETAEKLKQQDLEKQGAHRQAARESAQREPIPNTMRHFNAILAASKAQKNEAGIERLAERDTYRPDYTRYDGLKDQQSRGEISDAKAERLNRMITKPLSDKGFDPTDPPTHTRPNGRSRGGI